MFRKLSTVLSVLIIQLQEGGQLAAQAQQDKGGHDAQKEELRLSASLTWVKMRPTDCDGRQELDPAASRFIFSNKPCHFPPSIGTL